MQYDTDHNTLSLNENMKKGLKYIQFVDVLPRVQRDFIIFKMSSAQFTNYFSIICGEFKSTFN